jgi:succinate dehydrogenase/fumarate reductase flavoprotein subunit
MKMGSPSINWEQVSIYIKRTGDLFKRKLRGKCIRPAAVKNMVRDIMWKHVHMLRDKKGLSVALEELRRIQKEYLPRMEVASESSRWNYDLIEALETTNMVTVAELVTNAALARTETRGAHAREDYPKKDDDHWLRNIVIKSVNGKMELTTRPVVVTKLKPGE